MNDNNGTGGGSDQRRETLIITVRDDLEDVGPD